MKVAFIGLGRMGLVMASRLLKQGHGVIAYNRTAEKLAGLVAEGATAAASVQAAVNAADGICITMLADDDALRSIVEGPGGLLASLGKNAVHIAMGTHSVGVTREIAARHAQHGQTLLAAPVLGRPEAVVAGRLGIITGGPAEAVERCRPVLEAIGANLFPAGEEPAAAAAMKLANNMLLVCAIEAMGEAFVLVEKLGGNREVFRDIVAQGMFASPAYKAYSAIIADRGYDQVGFTAQLALKDVKLVLEAGGTAFVPLPSAAVCRDRLLGAIAHGDAGRDLAVLALEQGRAAGLA